MKCSSFFVEVIFFGVVFRQVWGNLGKNLLHPQKFACSYTYGKYSGLNKQVLYFSNSAT